MGFVTLGAFLAFDIQGATPGALSGAVNGLDGAMVQMISHGLISGALFLCIGVMYDRLHSREIGAYGGVINVMPKFGCVHGAVRAWRIPACRAPPASSASSW